MYRVCIDTGGTFSESMVLDDKQQLHEFKTATTPEDFSEGVINTLLEASKYYGLSLEAFLKQTEWIVHGTTVSTNALVQRKLAKTAMITTRGFRDIIEMRRSLKIETHSMYEALIPPYEPIVPRYLRFGVEEKTRYTGEIVKQVDEEELKAVIEKIKHEKVEAVAVCFINSYANPENEIKAANICKKYLNDKVFVTYSSDILPKMGEYERQSTCVISASVGPIVEKYLNILESKLKKLGFSGQLLIVQANQYVQSVSAIVKKPVYLTGSGPAAGPAGAVHLGNLIGEPNFLTGDMGGTTWDAAMVRNGQVSLKAGTWLGDDRIGIKVADVVSIGAGGGSIGWLNPLGLLQIGPHSASAEPGPACYGRGGTEPTTTDAALVLGYLNPHNFCGGKIKLNVQLARNAVKKIAESLKMSLEDAAQAMFVTVNSNMADCIAEISTRKGYDVRDFSLLAIGGGGPLCGVFVANNLGMKSTIVPRFASSFCAWSMFFLDIGRDYLRSYLSRVDEAKPEDINQLYQDMLKEALGDFEAFKVNKEDIVIEKSADVRYRGQYHMLEIKLPVGEIVKADFENLMEEFHKLHKELFTFSLPWVPIEIRNLRLTAKVKSAKIPINKITVGTTDPSEALLRKKPVYFDKQWVETPIYDGLALKAGNMIAGQAIIEEPTTTTVIPSGSVCKVDAYGNYLIYPQQVKLLNAQDRTFTKLDPITIATTWHYIQRVCREMRETVERTATNVLVVTLHDLAYGIWDAKGRVIAIPEGFPPRLISSTFPIRRVLEKFKGRIYPGDVFLTNYPPDGAVHLPDWVFIRPIFYQDELVFFTCMGTHVADSGGARAGSHFLAYDSIGEGLNIPLIKVVEKGEWRDDVVELVLTNNRLPEMMKREMASLMGSTAVAERRMVELLEKYDKETVMACLDEMLQRTEKAVRVEIAGWPEGTYFAEVKTDDDGLTMDAPLTIRVKLTIKAGELTFDFSGTDKQVKGMINAPYQQTLSVTLCTTFLFMGKELAQYHNEGSIKPIHVVTQKGTIVDALPGALVASAPAVTGSLTAEAVITVLSQALPDRAIAAYSRIAGPMVVGSDPRTDGLYVYTSFTVNGGAGAVTGYDGYQCASDIGTLGVVGKTDTEEEMVRFPWDILQCEYRTDAHGAGKWRGAPGMTWEGVNEGGDCTNLGGAKSGFTTSGPGQQGGEPTPLNRQYILRGNERINVIYPKKPIDLKAHDHFVVLSGGAAGVGHAEERDPEAVRMDVKNDLVSLEMAKKVYKVVINPDTLEIDRESTRKLRNVD